MVLVLLATMIHAQAETTTAGEDGGAGEETTTKAPFISMIALEEELINKGVLEEFVA